MALIKCPECGREISDKATTCPHCGAPVNPARMVPVTFNRIKKFIGWGIEIDIVVDGVFVGTAYNGDSLTAEIPTGSHQLQMILRNANPGVRGLTDVLTIPENANEVYFEMVIGNNGVKVNTIRIR